MRFIFLTCLLVSLSVVNSITAYRRTDGEESNLREKRWLNFGDEDSKSGDAEAQCPSEQQNCLACYREMSDDIKKKVCSFDMVAEVILRPGKECGQMRVERPIKFENMDTKSRFSMPSHCSSCNKIFNKTVTLLTDFDSFDYASEGFRFGPNTIVVEGPSPVRDCNPNVRRSIESESPKQPEAEIVDETEIPVPPSTTVATPTQVMTAGPEPVREQDKRNVTEPLAEKTERNIQGDNYNPYGSTYLTKGYEGNLPGSYSPQPAYGQPTYGGPPPSYQAPSYQAPSYQAPSYQAPSYNYTPSTYGSSYNPPAPTYGSNYDTPAPTYNSSYNPPAPKYEPSYYPPKYEPSYNPPAPTYNSSYNPPAPKYEPSYNPPAPKYEPSYNSPAPTYNSSYNPPNYEPSYNPPAPKYEPSYYPPKYEPSYYTPNYEPSYNPPTYNSSYNPPTYEPSYNPPSYNPPSYEPSYSPPNYEPSYNPPAQTYGYEPPSYGYNPPSYGYNPPSYGYNPPSYGYNPPPYGPGYNPPSYGYQQSYTTQSYGYNQPNSDYYASSSDQVNVTTSLCPPVADSCPKCISSVVDKELIKNLCLLDSIFQSSVSNYSQSALHGAYANNETQTSCGTLTVQKVFKSGKSLHSSTFSINDKCKCKELSESSVIIFSKNQSWSQSGLSLNSNDFVVKDSAFIRHDTQNLLTREKCTASQ